MLFRSYTLLIKNDIHFARKFDAAKDSKILDLLDERILKTSGESVNEGLDLPNLHNQETNLSNAFKS